MSGDVGRGREKDLQKKEGPRESMQKPAEGSGEGKRGKRGRGKRNLFKKDFQKTPERDYENKQKKNERLRELGRAKKGNLKKYKGGGKWGYRL